MKQILNYLSRLKFIATALVLGGVVSYTAYQVSLITNLSADPVYLQTKRQELIGAQTKFDKATLDTVKHLLVIPGQADATGAGKSDPFAP